jgi:hypothetical protein
VDDLAARRRRAWFGLIMVAAFGLLAIAALLPNPSGTIRVDQAAADETVPSSEISAIVTTIDPVTTSTTERPAVTTTVAPAPTTAPAPSTTTTAPAPVAKAPIVAVAAPAPVASPAPSASLAAVLACLRNRESHGVYTTVSSSGAYRGAYQFDQSAWDSTARHAGRPDLVGQLANLVSPADQDALALDLYLWQGSAPWGGACG